MMDYNNTDSILLILISLENADSKVFTVKNIDNTGLQMHKSKSSNITQFQRSLIMA